jgi:protocatechuate 3,4-dioxygenase beta subunit
VETNEDIPTNITLTATDPDDDVLTYAIVSEPMHGTLTGAAPSMTYTPNSNFNGPDSFTFQANDGLADSNIGTVNITVWPVNDAPIAHNQVITTEEDTPVTITLTATDMDGDSLTYYVVTGPLYGSLKGTTPNLTYTPNSEFTGSDNFTFEADDGILTSNNATISITITEVNYPPVADNQSVTTDEDTYVAINLTVTDSDGDPVTYTVETLPVNGELSGIAPDLMYTPYSNFFGVDSFTFKANDGQVDSNTATVTITVNAVNDAPVANAGPDQTGTDANGDGAETLTLDGSSSSDIDNPISFQWTEGSMVLGTTAIVNYNFPVGIHPVTLNVTDSEGASAHDEVIITVLANQVPVANAGNDKSAYVGDVVSFDGSGSYDPDGTIVSYEWNFGDGETDSGVIVTHEYASEGTYIVNLAVTDNGGLTSFNQATVTVEEVSTEPFIHVEDITIIKQVRYRKTAVIGKATVTVTVLDTSGTPVEGATVYGLWSNLSNKDVNGVTNGDGTVSFKTRWIRGPGTLEFSVTNVLKPGWIYDPDANMETWDSIEIT